MIERGRFVRQMGLSAEPEAMLRVEAGGRLRATNILILDTFRALPITRL